MKLQNILSRLPYKKPFLFVDELLEVSDDHICGNYRFKPEEYFYEGHFRDLPVTPGVILTEVMAQIGLVCLGIHLLGDELKEESAGIAMTSTQVDFFLPVYPGEQVRVESKKIYFRFNKLKCSIVMVDNNNNLIARGEISGMLKAK